MPIDAATTDSPPLGFRNFRKIAAVLIFTWTMVVLLALVWDFHRGRIVVESRARSEGLAHFNKDVSIRLWGTDHGLIYVPVTERMPPDPNLAHLPERDIETPSGIPLTLINPARIVRQLNEDYSALYGVAGRITNPNPLRPENAPDAWERAAINAFYQGEKERIEFTEIDGAPYLRMMRPLMSTPGCLRCHLGQGFELGGVAGGVGVSVPLSGLWAEERARWLADLGFLAVIWLAGSILLWLIFRRLENDQQQRVEAVTQLRASEVRKGAIMESALDCIIGMNHLGEITEFNPAAERSFGYPRSQVIGRLLHEVLIPPSLRGLHQAGLQRHLQGGSGRILGKRIETTAQRADGSEFPVELTVTRTDQGEHPFFTAYIRDMTEAHKLQNQLAFQSTHDDLTGLVNRVEFERRLERMLDEFNYSSTQHAVFYLDIDQFKVVNDTCGHQAGDALLYQISQLLRSHMRTGDTLARLGGDEFGFLLAHCSSDRAEQAGREILQAVREARFEWQEETFMVTASIGIVPVYSGEQTLRDILSAADAACYAAKDRGRNRSHLFHHDDVELVRRHDEMRWISRIHDAFEQQRFSLYQQRLQPLSKAGEGFHYEILLRMQDEQGEFVPPVKFLTAAERYGLISTIDRWVVRTALSWLTEHPRHVEQLAMCSINLSGHSLTDDAFLAFLMQQVADSGLPADRLCFEVTETAAVSNLSRAIRFIDTMQRLGCRFALDDFGSGMSSFSYLKNLPVDFLKIDGSFVRDIADDEIDLAMVRSINDIGHVMGKQTIAEFVENDAILALLKEMGIDYGQGYGIARPAPLEMLHNELEEAAS